MKEAERVMKRCQVGSRDYDEANNLHADCYRVIGKLLKTIEKMESQEPVAHMYPDDLEKFQTDETFAYAYSVEMGSPTKGETVPLYTHPLQRKPLTNEQIKKASLEAGMQEHYMDFYSGFIRFAKAIEAAHGIKG